MSNQLTSGGVILNLVRLFGAVIRKKAFEVMILTTCLIQAGCVAFTSPGIIVTLPNMECGVERIDGQEVSLREDDVGSTSRRELTPGPHDFWVFYRQTNRTASGGEAQIISRSIQLDVKSGHVYTPKAKTVGNVVQLWISDEAPSNPQESR